MGASREMTVAALAEPTVALAIFALALSAGSTNLGQIVARTMSNPGAALSPGHLLAFLALFIVTLAETGRLPVDNPATHLELTMIHEAMVLEYSGRHLALIEWAASLKLFVYSCVGIALFFPFGIAQGGDAAGLLLALPTLALKLAIGGFLLALIETVSAKMRIFRAPEFLGTAFMLAVLALLLHALLET
jgi:formate hydrogenlyase subunit 4